MFCIRICLFCFIVLALTLISFFTLDSSALCFAEEPWGKDSELCFFNEKNITQKKVSKTNPIKQAALTMIRFHQKILSPADGPRSHFYPSSSQYTLEAIQKYGFFKGFYIGCDRLIRENNEKWVYLHLLTPDGHTLKLDPIP